MVKFIYIRFTFGISISYHNIAIYHFDCGGFTIFLSLSPSLPLSFFIPVLISFSAPKPLRYCAVFSVRLFYRHFARRRLFIGFYIVFNFKSFLLNEIQHTTHSSPNHQCLSNPVNEFNLRVVVLVLKKKRNWIFRFFFHLQNENDETFPQLFIATKKNFNQRPHCSFVSS